MKKIKITIAVVLSILVAIPTIAQWNTNGNNINNTNSGNVGIGTSSPTYKLDVNGTVRIVTGNPGSFVVGNTAGSSNISYDGSTGATTFYQLYAGNLQTQTSGQTQIRGEVHPQLMLVNGAYIAGYQSPVMIKRTWPGVGAATLVLDDEGGVTASTYKVLQAKFNGTEVAYIKGDGAGYFTGDVGIGTTSPNAKLEINAGTSPAKGIIVNTDGTGTGILLQPKGASDPYSPVLQFKENMTGNIGVIGLDYGGDFRIAAPSNKMVMFGSMYSALSNVNINTYAYGVLSAPNNYVIKIRNPDASAVGLMIRGFAAQTGNLQEWQNSTGSVLSVVNKDGNLGIGISSPQGKLETPHLRLTSSGGNNPLIQGLLNGIIIESVQANMPVQLKSNGGYTEINGTSADGEIRLTTSANNQRLRLSASGNINVADANPLTFSTNNTERMRIEANGSVAIGTVANPAVFNSYKLAVAGNIITEKVYVKLQSSSWPDYVFGKDYNLPALKELRLFIQQNHHLPGVPSATEIEKNGLDLGDGQAVLLRKIEELTLHLLDMDKRVETLETENKELKKQLRNQ